MRKGSHVSEETRKRMSEAHKGKVYKTKGYVLDNRRSEPITLQTLKEVCEFLGYKGVRGFKSGNAYHSWIVTKL